MSRILIIDDEKSSHSAIKRLLYKENYTLEFAENGEEGLKLASSFNPDLVILDIMMPGMAGYEVCHRLKSDSETSDILVLLFSARSYLEERLKGYSVEADDFIAKPYDPEEFRAKVRILTRLKNTQNELNRANQNLDQLVKARTMELVKKERQAIIGQMIQGIVHNLRNPTMVVGGMTGLCLTRAQELLEGLERDDSSKKKVEEIIEYLKRSSTGIARIESLIDNLMAKSRHDAEEKQQSLNLNKLLMREIEFLDADADIRYRIKKILNLDHSMPEIWGTCSDFTQIFENMIINASNAMINSEIRELTISTRHDQDNIYLEFSDTGEGMKAEILDHIFDLFFTTKASREEAKEGEPVGTGLGLYTCSQLVKAYGGDILVESAPGEGARFTIMIPKH